MIAAAYLHDVVYAPEFARQAFIHWMVRGGLEITGREVGCAPSGFTFRVHFMSASPRVADTLLTSLARGSVTYGPLGFALTTAEGREP